MKKKRKNSNYKINFEAEKQTKKIQGNKFLLIFVCIFLAIVVLVGSIVGISSAVKNANAAVKYKGVIITKEEASFFASYYKNQMLSNLTKNGVDASDTEEFWNSKCPVADNYGELLKYNTREYIKQIAVANYIFDKYDSLSRSEKNEIKIATEEILTYRAEGDKDNFDSQTEKFGFSYSDFEGIVEKLYKARMADVAVFGSDGSRVANEEDLCKIYYSEYSRVKLLFIRTDKEFKLDEDGNRIVEDGKDVMVDLSEEEKQLRLADVATIREAILGLENDGSIQMSATMFETYLKKYPSGDDAKDLKGYFFHKNSSYTKEFSTALPEVTKASMEMEVGTFKEVSTSAGICFIYKMPIDTDDLLYLDSKNACFSDFLPDAATASFDAMVTVFMEDVEVKELYNEINIISLPYNSTFVPRF